MAVWDLRFQVEPTRHTLPDAADVWQVRASQCLEQTPRKHLKCPDGDAAGC